MFTNEIFAIIYSYISILEKTEFQSTSPTETSKHTKIRQEITLFSIFLHIIKENFTNDEVSQHTKHDLQKILAWFIIDYFTHKIDLISQARKNFGPQNPNVSSCIYKYPTINLKSSNKYNILSKRLCESSTTDH